jgi:hypothetical protein
MMVMWLVFAIVSKPDADLAVVEENIKQELKKKTTFHQKIPMLLEVSTLVKYSKK